MSSDQNYRELSLQAGEPTGQATGSRLNWTRRLPPLRRSDCRRASEMEIVGAADDVSSSFARLRESNVTLALRVRPASPSHARMARRLHETR